MQLSTPLPPEELIYLVNGHRDRHAFDISRRATVLNIIDLLREAGIDYRDFRSILDFGCGCGRILAGWEGLLDNVELRGFDINAELVSFAQQVSFAKVAQSGYYPPLNVAEAQIDFVYAASVFTHMTLPAAMQWGGELARIVAPGGVAMVSHHGGYFLGELARIAPEGCRILEERGFYCFLHTAPADTFRGSNAYATFTTTDFMRSIFKGFDLVRTFPGVSCGPNPFASYQDILIFRRWS